MDAPAIRRTSRPAHTRRDEDVSERHLDDAFPEEASAVVYGAEDTAAPEEPCGTCGDAKEVPWEDHPGYVSLVDGGPETEWSPPFGDETRPCPDCSEEPAVTEDRRAALPEEPCRTCGDEGEVWGVTSRLLGVPGSKIACPDCTEDWRLRACGVCGAAAGYPCSPKCPTEGCDCPTHSCRPDCSEEPGEAGRCARCHQVHADVHTSCAAALYKSLLLREAELREAREAARRVKRETSWSRDHSCAALVPQNVLKLLLRAVLPEESTE